jgi:hypothetical protein
LKKQSNGRAVLVTTAHRGVFFGYLQGEVAKEKVTLTMARNCVYWSSDVKGFAGLACTGPTKSCKIGPAADMTLFDVTCVAEVSEEATKAWEAAPWNC